MLPKMALDPFKTPKSAKFARVPSENVVLNPQESQASLASPDDPRGQQDLLKVLGHDSFVRFADL